MYSLNRITPISSLNSKDIFCLNEAISVAETSRFDSSKRLGAYLQGKGTRFLCR